MDSNVLNFDQKNKLKIIKKILDELEANYVLIIYEEKNTEYKIDIIRDCERISPSLSALAIAQSELLDRMKGLS